MRWFQKNAAASEGLCRLAGFALFLLLMAGFVSSAFAVPTGCVPCTCTGTGSCNGCVIPWDNNNNDYFYGFVDTPRPSPPGFCASRL
jgi:hypothetical protein